MPARAPALPCLAAPEPPPARPGGFLLSALKQWGLGLVDQRGRGQSNGPGRRQVRQLIISFYARFAMNEQPEVQLPSIQQLRPLLDHMPALASQDGEDMESLLCHITQTFYRNELFLAFDWPSWQSTADEFLNSEVIANASLDDICKLLTLHIRKDRFCEGHLLVVANSGHLYRILLRLQQLLDASHLS